MIFIDLIDLTVDFALETSKNRTILIVFFYFKLLFAHSTQGTYIILGKVFKRYTRFNTLLRVANLRVIDPMTYCTNILFHNTIFKD